MKKALVILSAVLLLAVLAIPSFAEFELTEFVIPDTGVHFAFDGNADDEFGNLKGEMVGDPTFMEGHDGKADGAIYFDDDVQYVGLYKSVPLGDYTASFWVWLEDNPSYNFLCTSMEGSLRAMQNPTQVVGSTINGVVDNNSAYTAPIETWTMLTFVYEAATETMNVYADGEYVDSMFGALSLPLTTIGNECAEQKGWQTYPFQAIDDTWFFGRMLTDAEIRSLYATNSIANAADYEGAAPAPAAAGSASEVLQTIHIEAMDYTDCGGAVNFTLQGGSEGVDTALSLKPTDASTPLDCYYDFEVAIDQDCEAVDMNFTYSASGLRHMQVTFNGETQVIDCPDTTGFDVFSNVFATFGGVKAGKYTLRIGAPEAYADDYKTSNVDLIDIAARNGSVSAFAEGAAPAAEEAPAAAEGYPSSGYKPKDGSAIIDGARIGLENGWDGTAASGRDSAFDGNIETFFDPLGTGDGWCGIDAGGEVTLTGIAIHPRTTFLDRFNGGTIEGSMDPEFENAVEIWCSDEAASAIEWQFIDQSDFEEVGSFRYYRYINYTNHGDVGEVELYGYPSEGEYEKQEAARQEAAAKAAEEAAAKKAEAEAKKAAEAEAKAAEEAAKAAEEAAAAAEEAVEAVEGAAEEVAAEAKSGCGSVIGGGLIVLVTVLGCGWIVRRKD